MLYPCTEAEATSLYGVRECIPVQRLQLYIPVQRLQLHPCMEPEAAV